MCLANLTGRFNCSLAELPKRVESLQEEVKKLQKQLQKGAASDLNSAADAVVGEVRPKSTAPSSSSAKCPAHRSKRCVARSIGCDRRLAHR